MGTEKDRQIRADDNWPLVCKANGWKCSACGGIPLPGELETYKRTGMCGYCTHVVEKD
ncbi:hypothetical protein D9M68_297880 [compost metagenome]